MYNSESGLQKLQVSWH